MTLPTHPETVRRFLKEDGNTLAELAREAGMHPNGLRKWRDADWNPRWLTLVDLCAAVATITKRKETQIDKG